MKTTKTQASTTGRAKTRTVTETPRTTMEDVARAKRNLAAMMAHGYEDPDEDVCVEVFAAFVRRGIWGEHATRILQRMLTGVRSVVCEEVQ